MFSRSHSQYLSDLFKIVYVNDNLRCQNQIFSISLTHGIVLSSGEVDKNFTNDFGTFAKYHGRIFRHFVLLCA